MCFDSKRFTKRFTGVEGANLDFFVLDMTCGRVINKAEVKSFRSVKYQIKTGRQQDAFNAELE